MQTALFTKVLSDRSLRDACEIAADIGYDGVEPMGRDPHLGVQTTDEEARSLRDHVDDLDLEIPCLASYTGFYVGKDRDACEEEVSELRRFCELADILGADLVRHGPGGPAADEATDADYEEGARWMRRAADVAAGYDKRLGVEIHGNTIVESASDAVRYLELVDRDNVGVIHDAGNMFICGEEYGPDPVQTLGDRLWHVHVKDERPVDDADGPGHFERETLDGTEYFAPALLGEGEVDFGRLWTALDDAGYDGFLTDECHVPRVGDGDDIDVAAHEYDVLERVIGAE